MIRGSAVNQDGRSSGLTAPNGPAQEAVIREALAKRGVAPGTSSYVEAHGTGTALGDPIEVRALAARAGHRARPADRRCCSGSVKTNIGHLEAAAGVAGLIKVVLALQHGEIPPHLHFRDAQPAHPVGRAPGAGRDRADAVAAGPWPRLAGVSSFGFSGTNAHVDPRGGAAPGAERRRGAAERPLHLLPLSAQTATALSELAGRVRRAT